MEKTRDPARDKHDRMLARCQESQAVKMALGKIYDDCGELIFAMVNALAELEERVKD